MTADFQFERAYGKVESAEPGVFFGPNRELHRDCNPHQTKSGNERASSTLVSQGVLPALSIDCGPVGKWANSKVGLDQPAGNFTEFQARHPGLRVDDAFLMRHPSLRADHETRIEQQKQLVDEKRRRFERDFQEIGQKRDQLTRKMAEQGITVDLKTESMAEVLEKVNNRTRLTEQEKKDFEASYLQLRKDATGLLPQKRQLESEEQNLRSLERFPENLKAIDRIEPKERREEIYRSLEKLLRAGDGQNGLPYDRRLQVARDLVNQIAHPEEIKQITPGTCACATAEKQLARNNPEVYARAVADWATGTAFKGTTIGGQALAAIKDDDRGERGSLASKIFQAGAMQLYLDQVAKPAGGEYRIVKPGTSPIPPGALPSEDTGDRIVGRDGKMREWQGLNPDEERKLLNVLTGGDNYVDRKVRVASERPEDMEKVLQSAIKYHRGPITTSIDKGGGGHAVTVSDVKDGKVTYDDPADAKSPRTLDIRTFHRWVTRYSDNKVSPEVTIIAQKPPASYSRPDFLRGTVGTKL